jgi:hypothetical protein
MKATVPTGEGNNTSLNQAMAKNLCESIYILYLMFNKLDVYLWRIGTAVMLDDPSIGTIDPNGRRMNSFEDHARRHLTLTLVRHHDWSFNAFEHAAVDSFPCNA